MARNFKEYLKDCWVYVNVQQLGLHRIAYRYLTFPCANIVSWILSHIDPKTMTLNSASGQRLSSFLVADYHLMYHLPKPESLMDLYFYATTSYLRTKDIVKGLVKEPTKFHQTPTSTYKKKYLSRAYHLLIVLCCRIYGQ